MTETNVALQLADSSADLGILAEMIAETCPVPTSLADDIELIQRMWAVGEAAREYALALIARISLEELHKQATKQVGWCRACGTVYDDIERNPPPKRCWGHMGEPCGLIFENVPLRIKTVSRYPTFEELEGELIERGVASHGTIYNRIQVYRRMIKGLGISWEDAYRAVRASPAYVDTALDLAKWNTRGEIIDVPESVQLPGLDGILDRKDRIEAVRPHIANTIAAGTGVIEDNDSHRVKVEQIQQVRLMRGKPVVYAYQSNPLKQEVVIPLVVTSSSQDSVALLEDTYELVLQRNGNPVSGVDQELLDAIYKELNVRIPSKAQRRELWK